MKNFFVKLFFFCLLTGVLNYAWMRFAPVEKYIPHVGLMILFFLFATVVFHLLSINAAKGKPQAFIRFYMGATVLRLMLYMLVIVIYRFYDKSTLIPFALGFMAHYFLFTVFEVPLLLKELENR